MKNYTRVLTSGSRIKVSEGNFNRKALKRLTIKELCQLIILEKNGVKEKLIDILCEK